MRYGPFDVLALATGTVWRRDRESSRGVGGGRAVVTADDVRAQVDPRGGAGRGENPAVVDVENIRIDE
ncbi:hypothetical protein Z951_15795 [Streptomyces sp. PRh5]|nr:hypothetical protein Z951_15795 [Streptomyces sp. PRh5]